MPIRQYTGAYALELIEEMAVSDSGEEIEICDETENVDIVLFPPKETAYVSDEDSVNENQPDGDSNHIGHGRMNTEVKMMGLIERDSHKDCPKMIKFLCTVFSRLGDKRVPRQTCF